MLSRIDMGNSVITSLFNFLTSVETPSILRDYTLTHE